MGHNSDKSTRKQESCAISVDICIQFNGACYENNPDIDYVAGGQTKTLYKSHCIFTAIIAWSGLLSI